jgi:hypothetical protein
VTATSLFAVCVTAFCVVFAVLAALAAAIRLLTVAFPERRAVVDAAIVAAVSGSVAALLPGARVTRIEEEP